MHPLQHPKVTIIANNTPNSNIPTDSVNFDLLTNGSTLHDFETNKQIILAVLKFIKDTNRFD